MRLRSSRRARWIASAAVLFGLGLNALAYRQAWAMSHFTAGGVKTPRPERLSWAQKARLLVTGPTLPRPRNEVTPAESGVAFERHVFAARDGVSLEAWALPRPGVGENVVVLFHGYADRKASLLPEALAFRDMGYAPVLVDFRGSGGSDGAATSIGYHEAEDVAAAFRYASQMPSARRVVLFGASMGAAAVMRAVGDLGLVPAAVVAQYPFASFRGAIDHRVRATGLPTFPTTELLLFWGGLQQGFDAFGHNPVDYAARIRTPFLLLQGDHDDRVSVGEARAIFERLAGPKRLEIFEGLGHQSFVKARSRSWRAAIESFLEAHVGDRSRALDRAHGVG